MISNFLFKSHLEEDESIRYVAHRHIFTEWRHLMKIIITGIGLPVLFYLLFPLAPFKYVWMGWGGIGLIKFIYEIFDWYFDAWVITNLSVIDVEWQGFFNRTSTRIEYDGVAGITYNIKGFWGTVLNYGDVSLEHFISTNSVVLQNAARPKKVERQILSAQGEYMNNKTMSDHEALKQMLVNMLLKDRVGKL